MFNDDMNSIVDFAASEGRTAEMVSHKHVYGQITPILQSTQISLLTAPRIPEFIVPYTFRHVCPHESRLLSIGMSYGLYPRMSATDDKEHT